MSEVHRYNTLYAVDVYAHEAASSIPDAQVDSATTILVDGYEQVQKESNVGLATLNRDRASQWNKYADIAASMAGNNRYALAAAVLGKVGMTYWLDQAHQYLDAEVARREAAIFNVLEKVVKKLPGEAKRQLTRGNIGELLMKDEGLAREIRLVCRQLGVKPDEYIAQLNHISEMTGLEFVVKEIQDGKKTVQQMLDHHRQRLAEVSKGIKGNHDALQDLARAAAVNEIFQIKIVQGLRGITGGIESLKGLVDRQHQFMAGLVAGSHQEAMKVMGNIQGKVELLGEFAFNRMSDGEKLQAIQAGHFKGRLTPAQVNSLQISVEIQGFQGHLDGIAQFGDAMVRFCDVIGTKCPKAVRVGSEAARIGQAALANANALQQGIVSLASGLAVGALMGTMTAGIGLVVSIIAFSCMGRRNKNNQLAKFLQKMFHQVFANQKQIMENQEAIYRAVQQNQELMVKTLEAVAQLGQTTLELHQRLHVRLDRIEGRLDMHARQLDEMRNEAIGKLYVLAAAIERESQIVDTDDPMDLDSYEGLKEFYNARNRERLTVCFEALVSRLSDSRGRLSFFEINPRVEAKKLEALRAFQAKHTTYLPPASTPAEFEAAVLALTIPHGALSKGLKKLDFAKEVLAKKELSDEWALMVTFASSTVTSSLLDYELIADYGLNWPKVAGHITWVTKERVERLRDHREDSHRGTIREINDVTIALFEGVCAAIAQEALFSGDGILHRLYQRVDLGIRTHREGKASATVMHNAAVGTYEALELLSLNPTLAGNFVAHAVREQLSRVSKDPTGASNALFVSWHQSGLNGLLGNLFNSRREIKADQAGISWSMAIVQKDPHFDGGLTIAKSSVVPEFYWEIKATRRVVNAAIVQPKGKPPALKTSQVSVAVKIPSEAELTADEMVYAPSVVRLLAARDALVDCYFRTNGFRLITSDMRERYLELAGHFHSQFTERA